MKSYTISELVDLSTIQQLAEGHYQTTGMPIGIINASDRSVLVATGWQDICTLFHRAHPSSLRYCLESDNYIKDHLIDGEACHYRCKNGLWDIGVPIMVAKQHMATIFLGQFFYEGESLDRDYFIRQAQQYGYNLSEYLAALDRVPVFTKEKVDSIVAFNKSFSRFMSDLAERSLSNFEAEQALRDSEHKFRALTETSPAAIFLYQNGKIIYANPSTARMLGFAEKGLPEMNLWDWLPSNLKDLTQNLGLAKQLDESVPLPFERKFTTKSGEERWGYISTGRMEYCGSPAVIVIIHDITKQKEVEEGLYKSEERFRLAMDATSDGLWDWDVMTDQGYFSPAYYRMLDYEPYDFPMTPQAWLDLMHPDDRELAFKVNSDCIENKVHSFESEFRLKTKTGSWKWILGRGKAVHRDSNGKALRLIGTYVDITERKLAEDELRKSNQRLDLLAHTANQLLKSDSPQKVVDSLCRKILGFLGCDVFFNYLVNDENTRLHLNACGGIPEEDVQKMEWLDYGVGLCGCSARDGCRLVVEDLQGKEEDQYTSLVRPFGIAAYACHPLISRGEVLGTLSFCTRSRTKFTDDELSLMKAVADQVAIAVDRKKTEEELRLAHDELEKRVVERTEQLEKTAEELRTSEERYALAVQGTNDGIWDLNLETGEAYHSPRWKSILGYEGDEISGNFKEWESRVHPDDLQRVNEICKANEDGRIPEFEVEYRLRHKDGGYRWVLGRGACLRDSHGKPYRMAGSISDITERKKLEKQLLQAQKMESVGILAGGVAHDFNNLLTAISGYGQILLETIPEDDKLSQESITNVLKAAERASELTRGLLAFSRKQVISPKPLHIDTLISNASRLIQRIIGKDIVFVTNSAVKNLLVKADPGQIEQVLMNLATNARDAMPHGGRLSITTSQAVVEEGSEMHYDLSAPGKYALISVADTGTGMDKKTLGSIFEPFFTTKEVGEGTGLGLSIVHGIIKQHNGSVLASSEPGKGTIIDIYLPLAKGAAVKEEVKITTPSVGGMETLLVAEDDETVRMFMKKILERGGYKVIIADDGEDAVARFRQHDDISLVLSDVVMPRKNGRELLNEIRRIKPGIKAIFISGYAAEVMQKKGIEEGTEFIRKPFKKEDLLRRVRQVLDKTR
ncbi:MAG TPA: PAS domain S-box protein [Geobacteraceae bacterium]|nr:PAS domain S-box protein [Geobacteraceae bacterium]